MSNPHYAMRPSLDPHPVRPGTSDALFARTIDATVHPPLVRAQETVAALSPRVAEPLGSPLLLSMLGLTLVLLWMASRMRFRPSALVLSGLLVMTLTSFHPLPAPSESRIVDDSAINHRRSDSWSPSYTPDTPEPAVVPEMPDDQSLDPPMVMERPSDNYQMPAMPEMPEYPTVPAPIVDIPAFEIPSISPDGPDAIRIPPVSVRLNAPFEISERDRRELRRAIEQLQRQLRAEARRQIRHRFY